MYNQDNFKRTKLSTPSFSRTALLASASTAVALGATPAFAADVVSPDPTAGETTPHHVIAFEETVKESISAKRDFVVSQSKWLSDLIASGLPRATPQLITGGDVTQSVPETGLSTAQFELGDAQAGSAKLEYQYLDLSEFDLSDDPTASSRLARSVPLTQQAQPVRDGSSTTAIVELAELEQSAQPISLETYPPQSASYFAVESKGSVSDFGGVRLGLADGEESDASEMASSDRAITPSASRPLSGTGFEIRNEQAEQQPMNPHDIEVRADGLSAEPVMSVGLIGSQRTVVKGAPAQFMTYTNYPSYVAKGELRIFADNVNSEASPVAIVPIDANGLAVWTPTGNEPSGLFYTFRAYDDEGRFDESKAEELTLIDQALEIDGDPVSRPNFGKVDEARVRNIQINRSATIMVTGKADPAADIVRVSGQIVPVADDGTFATQQLVDRDANKLRVVIDKSDGTQHIANRDINVPRSDWLVVGQGDLTFHSSNGNGPAVSVSGDPLANGDHITSRAAFYAKGRFGDDWKLTASLDTGETLLKDVFSNLDRKDPRQLLRRLNSNEYYTTYGDDSTIVEDAPTQGAFYLKLQKADSSLLFGNFIANINQAELAQLDRGLFGAVIDHKSIATTSFGERKRQITAFASDPGTIPGRDEFRGTGGSLYFLKRQDLSVGSERVRVEVRDRDTGLVLETHDLRPQEDYDIDYFQGRVTLLKPLASTAATGSTVREASSTGNVPVLVVRYEYSPAVGSLDGYTIGSRGSAWLGDKVRVGVTAQRETTDGANQNLIGADALIRLHAGTYLKAEVSQTEGPAFGQANSVDGGLTFRDINSPGRFAQKAQAFRVEGAVDIAELQGTTGDKGKISAFYENLGAGFSGNSHLTQSDTQRWGVTASVPVAANGNIIAKYEELDSQNAGKRQVASADLTQKFGETIQAKVGVRHEDQVAGLLYNSVEQGARTDAALELTYKPTGRDISLYGFGQMTLQNDATRQSNNRFGVGAKAELTDRVSLAAEVSEGQGGLGADVQVNRRYGKGSEAYFGYALLADRTDTGFEPVNLFTRSNRGSLVVGTRHRFSSALSIYGENRIGHGGTSPTTVRSFGTKFDPSERVSFSGSFENGRIDDATTGVFKRTAATFGFGYTTKEVQIGSNVEARFEKGNGRDQNVWLFRNSASFNLNPDWRALGRLNFAIAKQDQASVRAADYVEGVIGFAYRPVLNDRFNMLARLNYFQDLGPVGQITAGGETNSPKQRSKIVSVDFNYDLTKSLTIGAKYGYRGGKVSLDRTSNQFVSSNTQLGIVRADWRPVKKWDLLLEGRYLTNDRAGDSRWGALAAIYRHLGNNVKIGAGYNFSDYSDDLSDQSYSSKGLFINLLGKF
jgi:Glucodextranase, domain B